MIWRYKFETQLKEDTMNQPNSPFDENARGVYLITVTPFTEDGELDLESTDRLIDFVFGARCGMG